MKYLVCVALLLATAVAVESKPVRPPYVPPAVDKGPESPDVLDSDVIESYDRNFKIPFQINRGQPNVSAVRLYVSEDRGVSWKVADEKTAAESAFAFRAARDGLLWFAAQTIAQDGTQKPADVKQLRPDLKIYVNAAGRKLLRKSTSAMEPRAGK
jgi:hypothetical protein